MIDYEKEHLEDSQDSSQGVLHDDDVHDADDADDVDDVDDAATDDHGSEGADIWIRIYNCFVIRQTCNWYCGDYAITDTGNIFSYQDSSCKLVQGHSRQRFKTDNIGKRSMAVSMISYRYR